MLVRASVVVVLLGIGTGEGWAQPTETPPSLGDPGSKLELPEVTFPTWIDPKDKSGNELLQDALKELEKPRVEPRTKLPDVDSPILSERDPQTTFPRPKKPKAPSGTACPTCVGGEGTVPVDLGIPTGLGAGLSVLNFDDLRQSLTSGPQGFVNGPAVDDAPQPREDLFEDVVAVGRTNDVHCSGIAVSRRHVLTASHCLPASRILVGHRLSALVAEATVTEAKLHPDDVDLAILVVDTDLINSPRELRRAADPPRGVVRLVGFGVNDFTNLTGFGVKRRVDVSVSGWGCDERRARRIGCDPRSEMVIPHTMGRDTCSGDSGGPIFEQTTAGWRLVGITSRSLGTTSKRCGDGGVYVRLDKSIGWIRDVLNGESDDK